MSSYGIETKSLVSLDSKDVNSQIIKKQLDDFHQKEFNLPDRFVANLAIPLVLRCSPFLLRRSFVMFFISRKSVPSYFFSFFVTSAITFLALIISTLKPVFNPYSA